MSKVKVTGPINAVTDNQPYLRNGKAYTNFKLGVRMEYVDPHHRHARWPQRSKVRAITSRRQFDAFVHNTTEKRRTNTKIVRKVVRATGDIPHQFQGQGHQTA